MNQLNDFMHLLEGQFDNSEQFDKLKKQGINNFPFAKHVNTSCNNKIENLPPVYLIFNNFKTIESYVHDILVVIRKKASIIRY